MITIKRVCIFCGTQMGNHVAYIEESIELAKILIEKNIELVFGSGSTGLMSAISNEFIANNKRVIGVIPKEYAEHCVKNNDATDNIIADNMTDRLSTMIKLSDAFIALPGSIGTYSELFNVLYNIRLGYIKKPCGLLNIKSYYDYLVKFFELSEEEGFMSKSHKNILIHSDNPKVLVELIENYVPIDLPKRWE